MNWFALFGSLLKLAAEFLGWLREHSLAAAGEARGRAASDSAHAREAAARGEAMREIAENPPSREKIERRLEEGSA